MSNPSLIPRLLDRGNFCFEDIWGKAKHWDRYETAHSCVITHKNRIRVENTWKVSKQRREKRRLSLLDLRNPICNRKGDVIAYRPMSELFESVGLFKDRFMKLKVSDIALDNLVKRFHIVKYFIDMGFATIDHIIEIEESIKKKELGMDFLFFFIFYRMKGIEYFIRCSGFKFIDVMRFLIEIEEVNTENIIRRIDGLTFCRGMTRAISAGYGSETCWNIIKYCYKLNPSYYGIPIHSYVLNMMGELANHDLGRILDRVVSMKYFSHVVEVKIMSMFPKEFTPVGVPVDGYMKSIAWEPNFKNEWDGNGFAFRVVNDLGNQFRDRRVMTVNLLMNCGCYKWVKPINWNCQTNADEDYASKGEKDVVVYADSKRRIVQREAEKIRCKPNVFMNYYVCSIISKWLNIRDYKRILNALTYSDDGLLRHSDLKKPPPPSYVVRECIRYGNGLQNPWIFQQRPTKIDIQQFSLLRCDEEIVLRKERKANGKLKYPTVMSVYEDEELCESDKYVLMDVDSSINDFKREERELKNGLKVFDIGIQAMLPYITPDLSRKEGYNSGSCPDDGTVEVGTNIDIREFSLLRCDEEIVLRKERKANGELKYPTVMSVYEDEELCESDKYVLMDVDSSINDFKREEREPKNDLKVFDIGIQAMLPYITLNPSQSDEESINFEI